MVILPFLTRAALGTYGENILTFHHTNRFVRVMFQVLLSPAPLERSVPICGPGLQVLPMLLFEKD